MRGADFRIVTEVMLRRYRAYFRDELESPCFFEDIADSTIVYPNLACLHSLPPYVECGSGSSGSG